VSRHLPLPLRLQRVTIELCNRNFSCTSIPSPEQWLPYTKKIDGMTPSFKFISTGMNVINPLSSNQVSKTGGWSTFWGLCPRPTLEPSLALGHSKFCYDSTVAAGFPYRFMSVHQMVSSIVIYVICASDVDLYPAAAWLRAGVAKTLID